MTNSNLFKNSRVLITGNTGFKGCWLTTWLSYLGADITGFSIDIPTEPSLFESSQLNNRINSLKKDIRDYESLFAIINKVKPDFIFHLVAQPLVRESYSNPISTWETNTFGTINLLEALRKVEKKCVAVIITSDKCYDNLEWVWGYRETDSLGGADPYSASKGAAELAIKSYIKSFFPKDSSVRIGVGRAGNVIGGGDWAKDRIVPDCIRAWSADQVVNIRNPNATRPWQHVLEPLSGYISLAMSLHESNALHGEAFNFGPQSMQDYSVIKLVEEMSMHWNKVKWKNVISNQDSQVESGLLKLNCDKAFHYLGWHSVWNFEETIKETVNWYRDYYEEPNKSMYAYCVNQIKNYTALADKKNLRWTK